MAIQEFIQRFRAVQAQRHADDGLLKDMLLYCDSIELQLRSENAGLTKRLDDANLDLEDARKSRRDLQLQLNMALLRIEQAEADRDSMRNRNPYIMVLIDGDGMIFNEDLIRQGIEGGKQAANALRNTVLEHYTGLTDEIEIMAKVCANVTGLAKAMRRDGTLDNPEDLRDFTIGFTQGKASFDFVDCGHGKERADSKIKGGQILMGVSHDAGYAPFLDEVVTHDDHSRITIIEGPPTVRELSQTGIKVLNFNTIFRPEKLMDRLSTTNPNTNTTTWAGVTSIIPPLPAASPVSIKNGIIAPKKPTPIITPADLSWSPEPRGLDSPIAVNPGVLDKIKRRTTNNKLCNNHYLRGPCAKGDECCFEHNYDATEEDLKAIAYLTRLNPCTNGQDCDLEFCIYGHHCPSTTPGFNGQPPTCTAFGCRFQKEDHPPGTVIKHPRKERWEKDYERY
ncbi:hypothetical protein B7494_g7569 [Chlorociboria aeruginascens]|nr:hypothetical protein B7494_g7569 [Chlorociboria aeruginascens]